MYREEVEALRERAGRLPRLQEELRRCRERLQVAEACKGQLEVSLEAVLREGGACGGAGAGTEGRGVDHEEGEQIWSWRRVRPYRGNRHGREKWVRWCLRKGPLEDGADGWGKVGVVSEGSS